MLAKFIVNRTTFRDRREFIRQGGRCATIPPSDLQLNRVEREISAVRRAVARIDKVLINVQFTHINRGNEGKVTERQRQKQIKALNNAYSKYGIEFEYDPQSVVTVNKPAWFYMGHRSAAEREAKTELYVNPRYNLNFYTAGLQPSLLGWATWPFDLEGDLVMDGVVVLYSTLPGGDARPFNMGMTAVHEIGHWLGLYHTFEGGCNGQGDMVNDTEAHEDANYGCPREGRNNACPGETRAPIQNYMNYVDDVCMNEFTKGQMKRIKDSVVTYRQGLLVGP
jgi:Pregnancy-associated plasma protein-A